MGSVNVAYNKSYRRDFCDNNNDITKNAQLAKILDAIFESIGTERAKDIFKYTTCCLTNQENIPNNLSTEIKTAIEFIVRNKNNHWITNHQDVTQGAVQILTAASYKLQYEDSHKELKTNSRGDKIKLVNDAFDSLRNEDTSFPDLPRDAKGNIKFSSESYFDRSSIVDGLFKVSGKGYTYSQPDEKKRLSRHSDISDNWNDMETVSLSSNPSYRNIHPQHPQNQNCKKAGKLSNFNIFTIIKSKLNINATSIADDIDIENDKNGKKVTIKAPVTGSENINKLLSNKSIYAQDRLTLIPYGVTNRGIFHEDHSVLVAIYNTQIYVIDPKNKSDYQIFAVPYKQITTNMQKIYDRTNCGRYTAYTAIKLTESFLSDKSQDTFELADLINTIDKPNLSKLQQEFQDILITFSNLN